MELLPIGYLDAGFYYFGEESISMTILFKARLLQSVQPQALRSALAETMARFPVLRMGLGVRDNLLCYVENHGPLPIFPERKAPYRLGSEETEGYLFRVSYEDDTIIFSFSHGMTDGTGMLTIMEMLLDQYFRRVDPTYQGKTPDAVEDRVEPISLSEADAATPEPPLDIYEIPGIGEDIRGGKGRYLSFTVSEAALMEQVRKAHTSPAPYLIALLAHAVHQVYPVHEKPLLFQIPVDLRSRFNVNTCRNFAPSVGLPYDTSLEHLPFEERCAAIRALLRERIGTQRLRQQLYQSRQQYTGMPKPDLPPAELGKGLFENFARTLPSNQTATLTYVRIEFMPQIRERLRDVSAHFSCPPNFFVVVALGNGQVRISAKETEHVAALYEVFAESLRNQGIPVVIEEEQPWFDNLDLKRFG